MERRLRFAIQPVGCVERRLRFATEPVTGAGGVVCLTVDVGKMGDLVTVVSFASTRPLD